MFFGSNLPWTLSKVMLLTILLTLNVFTLIQAKIRAIKLQNRAKTWLPW